MSRKRPFLPSRRAALAATPALLVAGLAAASPGLAAAQGAATGESPAEPRRSGRPELPWAKAAREKLPPGQPGRDYTPLFVPNGSTLPFRVSGGAKVFHLVCEPVRHEVAPGLTVNAWGFNGSVPGPVIEACEGDLVRIYVTNRLPGPTSVHWHGVLLPCGMDGVSALTQPAIPPGETWRYEFWLPHAGTFMYHPHFESMTEEGMGLTGMLAVHPRQPESERPERDFALMLHEWAIPVGTERPSAIEMTDFNVLTINGKAFPNTHPLAAGLGERVRIRFGNLSAMDHHPIHLHGYNFRVVETDGGQVPASARFPDTTVLVPVGSTRVVEFLADNPGDWLMHCHMTHHTMNQMGHGFPNVVGMDPAAAAEVDARAQKLVPGYMTMGLRGMDHEPHGKVPGNSIPMLGYHGQFGFMPMGGMTTVLKVRAKVDGYADPGDYAFPPGTIPRAATAEELKRDGVKS